MKGRNPIRKRLRVLRRKTRPRPGDPHLKRHIPKPGKKQQKLGGN